MVASFKFVQEYGDKLIRDRKTRFGSSILRGVWDTMFAKVKQSRKNVELDKDVLGASLKQFQQHNHDWPSLQWRRNHPDEPKSGEAILGELYSVVDIIGHYLSQLHDSNDRNKNNFNR